MADVPGVSRWPVIYVNALQDTNQVCLNLKWTQVEEKEVKEDDDDIVNPDQSRSHHLLKKTSAK